MKLKDLGLIRRKPREIHPILLTDDGEYLLPSWQRDCDYLRRVREHQGKLTLSPTTPMQGTGRKGVDTIRAPFGAQYFPPPDTILPEHEFDGFISPRPSDVEGVTRWYHIDDNHRYGTTEYGWDVEQDLWSGSVKRLWTVNQKREIVALASRGGRSVALAVRKYNVSRETIRFWIKSGEYFIPLGQDHEVAL